MSNFKGKRMVSEDLIKKLEDLQPGGGSEYEPGTGIEISDENVISVDTDTIATKSELFSGDYDDLTNKPTIPTVNNNTITFTQGGATKGSFTLNQNSDATIALDAGGSTTEVAIGWFPEDGNRSGYVFDDLILDDLITLGLPIIATNDPTNYPLDSRIVLNEYYRFYGAGLIIYNEYAYRVVVAGVRASANTTYATKALNKSAKELRLAGIFETTLELRTANVQYGLLGSGATESVTSSNYLTKPYTLYKLQNATTLNMNTQYWENPDDRLQGLQSYTVQPALAIGTNTTGINTVTVNSSQSLPGTLLTDENAIYINSIINTHENGENTIIYGWNAFNKSFIDTNVVPDVSQQADGTYQLTATNSNGTTTYTWAAGGSGSKYLHKVKIYASFSGTQTFWTEDFVSSSATAYTSVSDYLTDRGYTITDTSAQPTKSLDTYAGTSIEAIAFRDSYGIYITDVAINSSGVATYGSWALQSNTPSIQDEVIAL